MGLVKMWGASKDFEFIPKISQTAPLCINTNNTFNIKYIHIYLFLKLTLPLFSKLVVIGSSNPSLYFWIFIGLIYLKLIFYFFFGT
jgi:hypothetical protein